MNFTDLYSNPQNFIPMKIMHLYGIQVIVQKNYHSCIHTSLVVPLTPITHMMVQSVTQ